MDLKSLKKDYDVLAKKYSLPSFDELDRDFEISKLDKENDFLLRAVRKLMMEKIVNSINFLEMLINHANAPRMYLPYIKTMSIEDRKLIEDIYNSLSHLTLMSLDLEINSTEEFEAKLVEKVFVDWNKMKPNFSKIVGNIKKPKRSLIKKDRSYFG